MKPSITYDLSNRQLEMLRRGVSLLIAMPTPPEPIRDAMRFARAALPFERIRNTEENYDEN